MRLQGGFLEENSRPLWKSLSFHRVTKQSWVAKYKRVKAKCTNQSLRSNPRQGFFERRKCFSFNWLLVQTLAKFVGA